MNKLSLGTAMVGLALAGAAAWWWQRPAAPATAIGAASAQVPGAAGARAGGSSPVEVARAEAMTLFDDVQAVGSLKARQGVMLRPEVSGRIARLGFADGQRVRQGQLMVQLDDTLQRAQLEQARAQASIARTNLQRSRELQAQNFVSQSAVDQNEAALQVAEAQVALAQAQLERMRVLAPFDGTAGLRAVDLGDYVKDGTDLVKLEDLSALEVEFALPERYVARMRPGLPVRLSLDALPGQSFNGQVVALNSQLDANGRALLVRARVQNPGSVLRPGMFARSRVVFATREGAVVVPEEALVPLGERQVLFKIIDDAEGRKVAQRLEANLGLRVPGKVEILQGLKAGDIVITAGQARLLRGDNLPVHTVDLAQAGQPGNGAGPDAAQRPAGAQPSAGSRRASAQP